jgi:hypothetical protein
MGFNINLDTFKKKFFLLDWDDNILVMPTKITLDKVVKNKLIKVDVDSHQFRRIRSKIGSTYMVRSDSFTKFVNPTQFKEDVLYSIKNNNFGPVYNKFITALVNGHDFAIITARGHSPKIIKDGIKLIINNNLTLKQKKDITINLNGETITKYLNRQKYYTVSSKEFIKEFKLDSTTQNPENGKKLAIIDYVENVVKLYGKKFKNISIGFSDDDLGNIKVVEDIIRSVLKIKFPNIHFVIYDTSNPKKIKKIRIYMA